MSHAVMSIDGCTLAITGPKAQMLANSLRGGGGCAADADGNKRHTGTSRASAVGDASACTHAKNASAGGPAVPPDLLAFVHAASVTDVAQALGMSRKSAWRLRTDHWPQDTRSVLHAWATYKGRTAQQQSGWFLRRVYDGGLVRHAGVAWTAAGLAVRTGQTLAVARAQANTLLAQTLELPAERFELVMGG